jgi:hypothetical protein
VNKSTTQNKVAYLLQGTTLAQELQYGNATLEARFLKLPAEEIDQLCIAEFERRRELVEQWRFYNQPHACTDFALFGKKGYWTAPETVALLLDKHSDVVNWHTLREFQAHDEQEFADFQNLGIVHANLNHYLTKRYLDLVVWLASAEVFIPRTRNVDPASALSWARDNNITIPPPLVAALDGKTARAVTWITPAKLLDMTAPTANARESVTVEYVSASPNDKPWFVPCSNDPCAKQAWYTAARYFARQLVIKDSTLITKRGILADKVSASLSKAGIKGRVKNKPFASGTVLKAFANVNLG